MQTLHFFAMGCQMLAVVDAAGARAAERLRRVSGWFAVWERRLSRFRPGSELARLNCSGGAPTRVSPVLAEAIGAAVGAARLSGGLVTPTALAALEAAGYDRPFAELAPEIAGQAHAPRLPADWRQLKLDPAARAVALPAGARLDLGGTAKGWAAAEAARRLSSAGPALVDAGGDIVVSGPMADGGPWPIAIASPFGAAEAPLGVLQLAAGAVATSGRDYRRWRQGGEERHHLIDPRTGRPADTDLLTATVVAGDVVSAEAAAKVALLLGSRDGMAWIEARPGLAAMLALADGRVLQSRRLAHFLAPPEPQEATRL
jgi:thiamine biosynthesis lipoprotein